MSDNPASWASSPGVARSMRSNKRRDTGPEKAIRSLLHCAGYRYRVDHAPDPGNRRRRADIVFTRIKLAVFVDGCFWHGCPVHATIPVRNRSHWQPKLERNRERDIETTEALQDLGWTVVRIWEHVSTDEALALITTEVRRLRSLSPTSPFDDDGLRATESRTDV